MANHFTDIGFKLEDNNDIVPLAKQTYEKGEKIQAEKGFYMRWQLESGAEIWASFNEKAEFLSLNPAFVGKSSRKVKINAPIERYKEFLEGSFHAESEHIESDPNSEGYPFMFDVPNFYSLPKYSYPTECVIQLTAFAHEIQCFDNEKEFYEGQKTSPKMGSKSFIPSGLFTPQGQAPKEPKSEAIFAGEVLKWQKMENEYTRKSFIWMQVYTLSGGVDIVADPALLNKEPVKGGYIMGVFWLSGKILDSKTNKNSSFISKLFNKK